MPGRKPGGIRKAKVRAFAKINLGLKVLNRRPDGFHEIRTVFQTIGLADDLEFEYAPGRGVSISVEDELKIENNLVERAARGFFEETGARGTLRVVLRKKIPMGGGLGGGSTDAAATLLSLAGLCGKKAPMEALARLAAALGSDVPFFLYGGAALGLGRGEELYPLPEPGAWPVLILAPPIHVSTPAAYRALGRAELTSGAGLPKLDSFQAFVWSGLAGPLAENDFEGPVFRLHPELKRWRDELIRHGAQAARLSGSGAALYGVFPDRAKLQGALPRFRTEPLQIFRTRFLTRAQYRLRLLGSLTEYIAERQWPPRSR
ncbi:MAG: 4-(cytidine 5'-diphospho)-2-C-methyl-D-erythritol kinase [Bryobacteraceae bacterium]|nr:4-(cytidine 5'-diphospho)-2-C-methyl-D-erythritol kinase [Bryobacteraceae bacterium]